MRCCGLLAFEVWLTVAGSRAAGHRVTSRARLVGLRPAASVLQQVLTHQATNCSNLKIEPSARRNAPNTLFDGPQKGALDDSPISSRRAIWRDLARLAPAGHHGLSSTSIAKRVRGQFMLKTRGQLMLAPTETKGNSHVPGPWAAWSGWRCELAGACCDAACIRIDPG